MTAQNPSDYVLNKYTNRLIKKGSKTHQRLISAKLLDEDLTTPDQNLIIKTNSPDEAKQIQSKLNKNIQKNKVITRRGSTVLKASRRPTRNEIIDKVSNIATDSIREHKDYIMESTMSDTEIDNYIKKLIQEKLVGNESTPPKKSMRPKVISTKTQHIKHDDYDVDDETGDY